MSRSPPAEADEDVLSTFVPPYHRAVFDSATDLVARDGGARCGDVDGGEAAGTACSAHERTLAQLRAAAKCSGLTRLRLSAYTTERSLQTGGFGRLTLVRVEGVDAPLAMKTVRARHKGSARVRCRYLASGCNARGTCAPAGVARACQARVRVVRTRCPPPSAWRVC